MIFPYFTSVYFAYFSIFLDHLFIPLGERYYPIIKSQFMLTQPANLKEITRANFILGKEDSGARRMTKE